LPPDDLLKALTTYKEALKRTESRDLEREAQLLSEFLRFAPPNILTDNALWDVESINGIPLNCPG
jgi:hypothetical protein